jgi:hypothetical protein
MTGTSEIRKSDIKRYLKGKISFNPWDVTPYCNKVFTTQNESHYIIDENGRISGKPNVDNTRVEMIAGLEPGKFKETYREIKLERGSDYQMSRKDVIKIIREQGKPVKEWMFLALVMNPEDVDSTKTPWLITSLIKKIDPRH